MATKPKDIPEPPEGRVGPLFSIDFVASVRRAINAIFGPRWPPHPNPLPKELDMTGQQAKEMLDLLGKMSSDLAEIKEATRVSAIASSKTSKLLERVMPDGEAVLVNLASR